MAKLRQAKFIVEPTIIKLSPAQKEFIRKKVKKNIREGRPPKQAVAISFSQARKKFGNGALISPKERAVMKRLTRILPKLTKKETEEVRKLVLKKLKRKNPPQIPLINLIPLLIGTFVILSVLKATQNIIRKRKRRS